MIRPGTILRLIVFLALIAFLAAPDRFAGLLAPLTNNGAPPIYNQGSLIDLTLERLGPAVEPGEAGGPPLTADVSLYEALGALLWSGRRTAPVVDAAGAPLGRVSLDSIAERAARPT